MGNVSPMRIQETNVDDDERQEFLNAFRTTEIQPLQLEKRID
jgi:hypothetical protein